MARQTIDCEVDYVDLIGKHGRPVPGVKVTCPECGHSTESFGTKAASVRRCLVMLREECPEGENNYYVAEEAEQDDGR